MLKECDKTIIVEIIAFKFYKEVLNFEGESDENFENIRSL